MCAYDLNLFDCLRFKVAITPEVKSLQCLLVSCSSGTLTNVLPHRNVMPHTQDMTPHPVTL